MVSGKQFLKRLEAPHPEGLTTAEMMLQNDDLLPVPPVQRTWQGRNYIAFWLADGFNINTWYISSSMIAAGLSWWESLIAVALGYSIAAIFLVLNANAGAKLHLVFPANIRYSFGIWGGLWPTLNRAAMACIWTGVQSWIGGQCVYLLLVAIWPSTANIPNGIPNSGTDTKHFLGFFLFSLLLLIPVWFPLHQIRHLFTVKAIVAPIAGLSFFIWFIVKAGGVGPIVHQGATVSGSARSWAFINAFMSCLANMATLITNAQDFASRAARPSSVVYPQLFALPLTFTLVSFLGIFVSSSSTVIYGETIWNPLDLLERVLMDRPSSGARAGVAFIAIAFIIAQVGTNVSANTISAGCDLTALFPRFLTIRRGGYIACLVSFCMCPWQLLKSSNNFTTYLSAYSVFLSSVIGVMLTEYWIIAKTRIKVTDLFTARRDGLYYYTSGVNPRAYVAYLCGIAINLPGFINVVNGHGPIAATHIYDLSFFTGSGVAFVIYLAANRFFPAQKATQQDVEDSWEFSENAHKHIWEGGDRGVSAEDDKLSESETKEDSKAEESGTTSKVVEVDQVS